MKNNKFLLYFQQLIGGEITFSFWAKVDQVFSSSRFIDFGDGDESYGKNLIILMSY